MGTDFPGEAWCVHTGCYQELVVSGGYWQESGVESF